MLVHFDGVLLGQLGGRTVVHIPAQKQFEVGAGDRAISPQMRSDGQF